MAHPFSLYGSHDASVCFKIGQDEFIVWELERLTKVRNYTLNTDPNFREVMIRVRDLAKEYHGIVEWGSCYYAELNQHQVEILKEVFGFNHFELMLHHSAHAAGALYQSDFEDCLIVSSDSGGNELSEGIQTFCIYHVTQRRHINKIASIPLDSCGGYTMLAVPISEIRKEDVWTDYLRYAGKIMGLAGYGVIRQEWLDAMKEYFYLPVCMESLKQLGEKIKLNLSDINTISGQDAYDLAATGQYVFEEVTISAILPFVKRYQLPVIHTGGSGLNVLLNERLRKEIGYPIFIPCNPNDCGLAYGFMSLRNPPDNPVEIQYNNFPILDLPTVGSEEYEKKYNAKAATFKKIARLICEGKTIGIMRQNSETGPRALGNRSILCLATDSDLKDRLNGYIKFREWFRPFAPVVKAEDAEKYFEFSGFSPFMSYAPKVKEQFRKVFPAITHEDGTARLQTVTKEQNEFLYNLIDAVETITEHGVLLNTSLNSKGRPIITTVEDAIDLWQNTGLDALLINDYLFVK
jgi:carbamoyltransferase